MPRNGRLRNMTSVYLLREDNILLLYRQGNSIVRDMWVSSAGGHFENHELNDPKACVLRELQEELGLSEDDLIDLRLRYATMRDMDGQIRINTAHCIQHIALPAGAEFQLYPGIAH